MFAPFRQYIPLALLLACSTARGQVIDKTVDLRADKAAAVTHSIVICARDAKGTGLLDPGHAFVAFVGADNNIKASVVESLGFYPAEGKGAFGSVPGKLVNEATANAANLSLTTHRLILHVDPAAFASARKRTEVWKTSDYNLYHTNCTSFVHDVLQDIGIAFTIKKPNTEFPSEYVSRLIESVK